MTMRFIRVKYGKGTTPKEMREYQHVPFLGTNSLEFEGVGPVGTKAEIREFYPDEELEFYESIEEANEDEENE